jgi:ComF family protein
MKSLGRIALIALGDLADLLTPPMCYFCHSPTAAAKTYLCGPCMESIERIEGPVCHQCGIPFRSFKTLPFDIPCGACLSKPPPYSKARFAAYYSNELRQAIIDFKYKHKLHLAKPLGKLIISGYHRHYKEEIHDGILPIPMHPSQLRRRGFNQSTLLALALSRELKIPLHRSLLIKTRKTEPQASLNDKQRLTNLKGSFSISNSGIIGGKNLLLVDDVATTRATLNEASKTVLKAGANKVDALALALRPQLPKPTQSQKEEIHGPDDPGAI